VGVFAVFEKVVFPLWNMVGLAFGSAGYQRKYNKKCNYKKIFKKLHSLALI